MNISIKSILIAMIISGVFAVGFTTLTSEVGDTYNKTYNDSRVQKFQNISDKQESVNNKMESIQDWLGDLTTGDVASFTFALPEQIGKILGVLLESAVNAGTIFQLLISIVIPTSIGGYLAGVAALIIVVIVIIQIIKVWAGHPGDI